MALRRVLPSRQPGAAAPEAKAAPAPAAETRPQTPSVPAMPLPQPQKPVTAPAVADVPARASETEIAAAAASAFGTLPVAGVSAAAAAPARVLEESFTVVVKEEKKPQPQPAEATQTQPEKPAPSVADFQPAAIPEAQPSTPEPQPQTQPEQVPAPAVTAPQTTENPSAPEPETVASPAPQNAPETTVAAAQEEPQAPQDEAEKTPLAPPVESVEKESKAAEPQTEEPRQPVPPVEVREYKAPENVSLPQDNPFKRRLDRNGGSGNRGGQGGVLNGNRAGASNTRAEEKTAAGAAAVQPEPKQQPQGQPQSQPQENQAPRNRVKRQRDFAAATVAPPTQEKPRPSAGTAALAETVPVNTRPLDKVDEELIASGIIAGPQGDTLTSNVPISLAVAEEQMEPPHMRSEPLPEPLPISIEPTPLEKPQERNAPSEAELYKEEPTPLPGGRAPMRPQPVETQTATPVNLPEMAPLPAVTSDLPWTSSNESGWEVELPPVMPEGAQPPAPPAPPLADFYKPQTSAAPAGAPAWARGSTPHTPPPELPGVRGINGPATGRPGAPVWGIGLAGVAVVVVALLIWHNSGQQNQLHEKVANWTGTLNQEGQTEAGAEKKESNFSMAELPSSGDALLPPPTAMPAGNLAENMPPAQNVSSSAQINFADVPPEQANTPIMADGSEKMPEDVSLFAKFQQAVAEARAKKGGEVDASGTVVAGAEGKSEGPLTPEKLKEELSAYRRSLMEGMNGAGAPQTKTADGGKDPAGYMDGRNALPGGPVAGQTGADGKTATGELLPPPELYTNNPKNLPIVGEPVANAPARVRTLADFEVAPFEPEKPKVRIPRMVKPKMAATDFPTVQILSYVPGRGIIAYAGGREGVLLLGETLDGWELTNVTSEVAEFRAGQKRHYISANE